MNHITILLFGQIADIIDDPVVDIREIADTDQLRHYLIDRYPRLAELSFLVTVDKQIARQSLPIGIRSEVALLPPFSGG